MGKGGAVCGHQARVRWQQCWFSITPAWTHFQVCLRVCLQVYLQVCLQANCAWCMDMHTKELRAGGETEQRLYLLSAWRECPFYSERERAALAWTEALTLLGAGDVADDVFALARGSSARRNWSI